MRLLVEQDNGAQIEVNEIEGIPDSANTLIVMCGVHVSKKDIERVRDMISTVTGKQCLMLGPEFIKVIWV